MPEMPRLSTDERQRVIGMVQAGMSLRAIARMTNCHHSTIVRLNERYRTTGSARDNLRSGQPRVTTAVQDRHIVLSHLRNRFLPASQTARETAGRRGQVSRMTVIRRLRETGLTARRPYVGPNLTQRHRQQRLQWAQEHVRWTRLQWNAVLFTDESRFSISFADGRVRIWRRCGERFADCCVREHNRFGGGSIHVWGGFSFHYRLPLHVFRGNVNAVTYRDEVLSALVAPAFTNHPDLQLLQQDNARAHTAHITQQYLQQQNIVTIDWPSLSPDMAPIEHLWDELGRRVYRQVSPANLQQLEAALTREWDLIPQNFLQRLVNSMRSRCQACLLAHGGHTRY